VDAELARLERQGVIERVPFAQVFRRAAYSTLFTVPKSDGRRRVVIDLSRLSRLVAPVSCRLPTVTTVRQEVLKGSWAQVTDLSDAYHSIALAPASRDFTRFRWGQDTYRYKALPMGLGPSAGAFTAALEPVLAVIRIAHPSARLHAYIDDILVSAPTCHGAAACTRSLRTLLAATGFTVNWSKSMAEPSQVVTFLGFAFDFLQGTISVTADRATSIRQDCRRWLRRAATTGTTPRALARTLGRLSALSPAVPHTKARTAALMAALHTALGQRADWDALWCIPAHLQSEIARDIAWWSDALGPTAPRSAPLQPPPPRFLITTDASLWAGGATLIPIEPPRLLPPDALVELSRTARPLALHQRFFSAAECASQNSVSTAETRTVLDALGAFAPTIAGTPVAFLADSQTTLSGVRRQRSRVPQLRRLLFAISALLEAHNISLVQTAYVTSEDNSRADLLSRLEWPTTLPQPRPALTSATLAHIESHLATPRLHDLTTIPTLARRRMIWPPATVIRPHPAQIPNTLRHFDAFGAPGDALVLVAPLEPHRRWFSRLATAPHCMLPGMTDPDSRARLFAALLHPLRSSLPEPLF
jgi:hypothetical protein